MSKIQKNLTRLHDLAVGSFSTTCKSCNKSYSDYYDRKFILENHMCISCEHALAELNADKNAFIREHMEFHGFDPDNPDDVILYQELGGDLR